MANYIFGSGGGGNASLTLPETFTNPDNSTLNVDGIIITRPDPVGASQTIDSPYLILVTKGTSAGSVLDVKKTRIYLDENGFHDTTTFPNLILQMDPGSGTYSTRVTLDRNGVWALTPATSGISFGSDTFITRTAAATLQHGAADAAAPVAQTVKVQGVVAGTSNTAGADFTLSGSQSTGTGKGGKVFVKGSSTGSSGTAQNVLITRDAINCQTTLTNGTATALFDIVTTNNSGDGGLLDFEITATDGTDWQTIVGSVAYSVVNKAGVLTVGAGTVAVTGSAASSGTITATLSITTASNTATVKIANTSTVITPTTVTCIYAVRHFGTDNISNFQ